MLSQNWQLPTAYSHMDKLIKTGHNFIMANHHITEVKSLAIFAITFILQTKSKIHYIFLITASGNPTGVNLTIMNNTYNLITPRIALALYDGNKLIQIGITDQQNCTVNTTKTYQVGFPSLVSGSNYRLKYFLWDMNSLIPYSTSQY